MGRRPGWGSVTGIPVSREGIRILGPAPVGPWREAIGAYPGATVFHSPEWASVFQAAYGHRPVLVCGKDPDGGPFAVPISIVPRPFGRAKLVSMPYSDFAGPLSSPGKGAVAALMAAEALGSIVEVRTDLDIAGTGEPSVYSTYRIDLPSDAEEMLHRLPKKSVRYAIGRAERDGVSVRRGGPGDEAAFHRMIGETRRRHGLPTPPLPFYRELFTRMVEPGHGSLYMASGTDGSLVAASLFLWHGERGYYKYSAGNRSQAAGNASHLLLWYGVREAIERGCLEFDLGRVSRTNRGLADMKRRWCGEEIPLFYVTVAPDGRMEPVDDGEGLLLRSMRAILPVMPSALSRLAGGLVYRYFS